MESQEKRTRGAAIGGGRMTAIDVNTYFELGFGVVPVRFGTKIPMLKEWESNYFKSKEEYEEWKKGRYRHNIGIVTGKASNIIVIDIDKAKSEEDKDGEESLAELIQQLGELPPTVEQKTRSGARQLFFKYPEGVERVTGTVKFFGCIDIRGDDNQVIVHPSVFKEEGKITGGWSWIKNPLEYEIAELPKAWLEFILANTGGKAKKKKSTPKKSKVIPLTQNTPATEFAEGSRNDELFRYLRGLINVKALREETALLPVALYFNDLKCNPPLEHDEVKTIVSSVLSYKAPEYINEKGRVIPYLLTEFILQNNIIVHNKGVFYRYNGVFYEKIDDSIKLSNLVDEILVAEGRADQITSKLKTEVCFHAQSQCNVPAFDNTRGFVNFKNGILDIKNKMLIPHTPKFYTLGCYNAVYDPSKADITGTAWETYLKTTLGEELIPLIQELIGVCLCPLTDKTHSCFFLIGNGSNGKSVLMQTIASIVPLNLRSSLAVEDYDKRFINSAIKGKTLNINMDDPTTYIEKSGNFKKVMAGEEMAVERKGVDVEIINPIVTHISSFNTMPAVKDKSDGFFRRLITIPFTKSFGTLEEVEAGEKDFVKDKSLLNKILNELDIITAWGVEGLYRVINQNYAFSEIQVTSELKNDYRLSNDTIAMWCNECIKRHKELKNTDCINTTRLFNAYREWCQHNGYNNVSRTNFNEQIKVELKREQHTYLKTTVYRVSFKGFCRND